MTVFKITVIVLLLFVIKTVPGHILRQTDPEQKNLGKLRRQQADSLRDAVRHLPDDTTKVLTLTQYATAMHVLSLDTAYTILLEAKKLTEELAYARGKVKILSQMGSVLQDKKDYTQAIEFYKQAYEEAERNNFNKETLEGYQQILNLYFYLGSFAEAMKVSTKGLVLGERLNSPALEAYYSNLIGFIYLHQQDIDQSEKYYNTYLALGKQVGDSLIIADAYNNLAEVYTARARHDEALKFLFAALDVYQRLYARNMLWKGDRLAYTHFKIGCAYKAQRNFNEALKYCLKAIDYTKTLSSNKYDIASYYIFTGDIYKELNNLRQAIPWLMAGLSLAKSIRHRENIRDAYAFLAQAYAKRKQYDSAYYYQRMYNQLADSIVNEKSRKAIEQIMATYSLEKKNREIETLQQQKQLSTAEAKRNRLARNAVIMIMTFSLILLYLLYNRYRLQQKNKFQVELNLQQNKMFNAIATLQDQERKRIAQDIHDTLGSILSTAKLRLSGMEEISEALQPQQREHYYAVIALLDEAVMELRNISHNIMPATLSQLGLVAALQNLFDKITSYAEIRIHYNVHGIDGRLDDSAEIIIYRIILELINNIVKHSGASNVTVQLIQYSDHINATVEDDGNGFDLKLIKNHNRGIGLKNIVSRIEYLKGKIEIDTGKGHGTSIVMDIPLPAR